MPESKKYYYLKLKEGFFDSDEMIVLESMPDGYLYSNILLKLYLRSLKYQGRLMFNDRIPFNSTMLAQVTRHSVGVVEKAMRILQDLGLVEILDNGAIYMSDIQNFIGRSSTEADRIREYRNQIESEKSCNKLDSTNVQQMNCKRTPEIEIEIEKDTELKIDLEIEKEKKSKRQKAHTIEKAEKIKFGEYGWVKLTSEQHNRLISEYGPEEVKRAIKYIDESAQSNRNKNGWTDWNLVVRRCIRDGWGTRQKQKDNGNIFAELLEEERRMKNEP